MIANILCSISLLFLIGACGSDSSGQLQTLIDGQKELLKQVKNLEKKVSSGGSAKPSKNAKNKDDYSKVYKIAQGNSTFVGNPNAKVVLTEFFDFQ